MRNIKYNYVCRNKGLYYRYITAKRHRATWNGNKSGCLRIVRLDRFMVRWIMPVIAFFVILSAQSSIAVPDNTAPARSESSKSKIRTKENAYAILKSIRVAAVSDSTLLDINVSGRTLPVLAYSGKDIVIMLSNTKADKRLAEHINTAGYVKRITVDKSGTNLPGSELKLVLSTQSVASLVVGPDSHTFRIKISPSTITNHVKLTNERSNENSNDTVAVTNPKSYSFDAYDSDVVPLFKSLANQSGLCIILIGNISSKISVHFKNAPAIDASAMLAKSAGLIYYYENNVYYVGSFKDVSNAFPTQQIIFKEDQQVYQCRNVTASDLANSLASVFDHNLLRVTLGAGQLSPKLDGSSTSTSSSSNSTPPGSGAPLTGAIGSSSGAPTSSLSTGSGASVSGSSTTRTIILSGEPATVANALSLAARLDIRRAQVKIDVRITDISVDALKELGVQWTFSDYTIREKTATELQKTVLNGIGPGAMTHNPLSFDGAISALENNNKAKLLAAPSMSLLDGEKGSILIGQRVLYPVLVGYTQAQTPIYDKQEEKVGIYLQLAVQMASNDEIILSVYPQVSFITSYLNINGASYPQISTREQQTTVRVKNGQGIVIGGLISNQDIHDINKVPLLSSIPFFGDLFKHRKTSKTQDEVVIMLTPVIQTD